MNLNSRIIYITPSHMKKSHCTYTENMQKWGLFLLRLSVGIIFVYQGWAKLTNMEGTIGFFTSLNLPAAAFLAYLVAFVEFLGGIAVLLGVWTRFAAKLLAIIMVVAFLTVGLKGGFKASQIMIALLGSTSAIALLGGGSWQWMAKNECPGFCMLHKK